MLSWLPAIKFAIGAAVLSYGLIYLNALRVDRVELQAQVLEETVARASAQILAMERANANVLLQDALDVQQASLLRARERLGVLNTEFGEYRRVADEEKAVFDEHDFAALTSAKPGLIERLANRATKRQFEEFEKVFNGE